MKYLPWPASTLLICPESMAHILFSFSRDESRSWCDASCSAISLHIPRSVFFVSAAETPHIVLKNEKIRGVCRRRISERGCLALVARVNSGRRKASKVLGTCLTRLTSNGGRDVLEGNVDDPRRIGRQSVMTARQQENGRDTTAGQLGQGVGLEYWQKEGPRLDRRRLCWTWGQNALRG